MPWGPLNLGRPWLRESAHANTPIGCTSTYLLPFNCLRTPVLAPSPLSLICSDEIGMEPYKASLSFLSHSCSLMICVLWSGPVEVDGPSWVIRRYNSFSGVLGSCGNGQATGSCTPQNPLLQPSWMPISALLSRVLQRGTASLRKIKAVAITVPYQEQRSPGGTFEHIGSGGH